MRFGATNHACRNITWNASQFLIALRMLMIFTVFLIATMSGEGQPHAAGSKAPDFTLSTPMGVTIRLAQYISESKTVLVALRGCPGYQCPYCGRQVHDFVEHASEFGLRAVNILLVSPGLPAELDQRAKEFLAEQAKLPSNITLVIDPDSYSRSPNGSAPRVRLVL
jgi:peroxiredoxin